MTNHPWILAFAAALGAAPAAGQKTPPAPPPLTVDTLAPGLFRIPSPPDGTVLLWLGPGGPVQVDGLTPALAARLDALVRSLAGGPPRVVVNTHYHEDHRGMNALARAAGAQVVAHPAAAREMAVDTTVPELEWHRPAAPAEARPTVLVDSTTELPGGVILIPVEGAHTAGDLLVHLPDTDVLHAGDVVEVGAFPFLDVWAGGTIRGLLAAVDTVLARSGPDTRIVPGHGRVVDRAHVAAYREMLAGLRARVAAAVAAGEGPAAVLADPAVASLAPRWGSANQLRFLVETLHRHLGGG